MPLYALDDFVPSIAPDAWIAPTAAIIGKVRLAARTGVWFGAVLRGDNEEIVVGAGSNIQEGCTLHTDMGFPLTVGENCTIGHNVILHGCTIGAGTLIGMGAIIMNGAVIGENSIVGAGALVTEKKIFEPFSLIVGTPAKAVRTLDASAVAGLRASADSYAANAARFAKGLREIKSRT